jgi:predicted RND superfamily exporter protein
MKWNFPYDQDCIMKKINSLKLSFLILIIPTLLLFAWTKDLAQNNKEYLFLNKDLKHSYDQFVETFGHDDQLLLEIPKHASDNDKVLLNKVSSVISKLSAHNIDTWTTPVETTRKKLPSEWLQFYDDHPEMDFKLTTKDSLFLVIQVPNINDKEQILFYKDMLSLPFAINMAGMGYTNYHLNAMGETIQTKLFPMLFILTLLATYYYYRKWEITLFVFINSLFATMIGLAVLKLGYGEANILTTSVPLINFVTTQSLSIHIISGLFTYQTIGLTYKRKLTPMLLMVSSTIVGFFSLITSDIIAVKQFAITSSLTLLVTTIFFMISWQFILKGARFEKHKMTPLNLFYSPNFITRPMVYIFSILCLLLAVYAYPRLTTTVEALYFFPKDHQLVTSFNRIESSLGGTPKLDIVFSKPNNADFEHPDLIKLDNIQEHLKNELINQFPKIHFISPVSLIKNANYAYTGDKKIPESALAASAVMSQVPASLKSGYSESSQYHLTILNPTLPTKEYDKLLTTVKRVLEHTSNEFKFSFNGLNYTLMQSQKNLIHSLLISLGLSMALVCLIVGISFRDLKKLSHFVISNTPPLTLTIAILFFTSTSLNISTIKTFSISFGMIFDSTIHLLYNYKRPNLDANIFQHAVLNPIYLSSFVTISSFMIFGFHDFVPIKQFGLLLAFLLTLGLFFDVLLLPVLEKGKVKK